MKISSKIQKVDVYYFCSLLKTLGPNKKAAGQDSGVKGDLLTASASSLTAYLSDSVYRQARLFKTFPLTITYRSTFLRYHM